MSPDFKVTLDIAQLIMLGGLIWGLSRMNSSVSYLTAATAQLTTGLKEVGVALGEVAVRVRILEDRQERRLQRHDDPA